MSSIPSIPIVYNPELISFERFPDTTHIHTSEVKSLQHIVEDYLTLHPTGLVGKKLNFTATACGITANGDAVDLSEIALEIVPELKSRPDYTLQAMQAEQPETLLGKLLKSTGIFMRKFNNPPENKRFRTAALLHEGLHIELEKHFLGDIKHVDHTSLSTLKLSKKRTVQRNKIANKSVNTILNRLKHAGFSKDDVRLLLTRYYKQIFPEEFFTTLMEVAIHLKLQQSLPETTHQQLGISQEKLRGLVAEHLKPFSEREIKLTENLIKLSTEEISVFGEFMKKIDTHWDVIAPTLLRWYVNK